MKLQLRKFDMASISDDKVVVMIGKRDTGKSFLCRDLLYYHQDIPVGTVISATEVANCFYGKMVPPLFIHNEYSEEVIKNVLIRHLLNSYRLCFELETYEQQRQCILSFYFYLLADAKHYSLCRLTVAKIHLHVLAN